MPFIGFLVSKRRTYIIAVILLLGKIMPSYFYYKEKKLVCIIIIAPSSCQPSSYFKFTQTLFYEIILFGIYLITNLFKTD